ncbi:MAG: hypothetical protein IJO70_07055 [Lachnospiraceae bacterium]|nr:hypothetical protein [Lachnospiraceae bacterium]
MEKWEIQQRIYRLNAERDDIEEQIISLNGKKGRIILESERKSRQQRQASTFFMARRQAAASLREGLNGNAVSRILEKYENIYGCTNENTITGSLGNVGDYLSKNCDKIDDLVADLQGQISSIDWQISECYRELREMESEEV